MKTKRKFIYGTFPADYSQSRLADVCVPKIGIQSGPFGSQLHQSDYVKVGTPIITVEHLQENRISHKNIPFVSSADRHRLIRYSIQEGDIVFSRVGSVDRRALVRLEEDGWMFSGRCLRVRVNTQLMDASYVSWFFGLSAFTRYLRGIAVGATMPSINTKILSDVPILYPDLPVQRDIANILDALHDKIAANWQMNHSLNAMTRLAFDRRFPQAEGHNRPTTQIERIVDLGNAKVHPPDHPLETFDHYSIPAFDAGQTPKRELGDSIKSAKLVVPPGSVLLSRLNPRIPRIWIPSLDSSIRSIASTEFAVALPKGGTTAPYLYGLFGSSDFQRKFASRVTGTSGSHQRVKPNHLLQMEIQAPSLEDVSQYTQVITPMLDLIHHNRRESATLAELRDLLLPKLISGEIQIEDAEKRVKDLI